MAESFYFVGRKVEFNTIHKIFISQRIFYYVCVSREVWRGVIENRHLVSFFFVCAGPPGLAPGTSRLECDVLLLKL